ncbi:response regulator [Flavobacterium sp. TSSA_36]|uniref:response regulator n=1 Tax=Flavobacterium sp. TSSA_36 TaxID=3447669 RepID=UPI003F300292
MVKTNEKKKIFLVDDDMIFLKMLTFEFQKYGDFAIETFETGELCLENLNNTPDIIILDFYLDGITKSAMNGLETLDRIKIANPNIPVIMLSSQDKIDVAISCMHHKAFDYIVKSETAFLRIKNTIETLFKYQKMEKELKWYIDKM